MKDFLIFLICFFNIFDKQTMRMGKAEDYRGPCSAVIISRKNLKDFKYLINNGWILNQKFSMNSDLNSDKWVFTVPKKIE